ncbi:MAG TPA: hypothetical protein VFX96_06975, partial [Pyrinomonadaceae bacterium]|nr:hypothetical protein [Pyrinomonadaceae bacterium]
AGYFSFNDLPGGTSYTLTASKPGVTFSPSRQTFSLSGDVRVAAFTGARQESAWETARTTRRW